MRLAALYDVHGMLDPLEAVLAEVEREAVDAIVVGGDAVNGPQPAETLARLRSLGEKARWIRGNGDRALGAGGAEAAPGDEETLGFTASRLTDSDREFLSTLPEQVTLEVDGLGPALFCHATPRSDLEIVTEATPDEILRVLADGVAERVVVAGHTHMQLDRRVDGLRWVNPGSVGMPYEGEVAAFWALLGPDVELRRTPFEVDRAVAAVLASGWPAAEPFVEENLLAAVTRDEVVPLFERIAEERGER